MITYGDANFFEPWWIQIVKALVIFGLVLAVFPVLTVYERKLMGRLQSSLRPQPRRAVRAAAADGRDRQVRHQGAVQAADLDRRDLPDGPDDLAA